MSAGKNAIPLIEGNKKWKDKLPGFICNCGYSGKGHELLCEDDDTTMWCPMCETAGWIWN
ncbi:hypothetical protein LCGC14_1677560 [marine sediment metagenome]|uniref:Uncharacterized protein n=1 Tax=marine sediment metagenome TaxID=412755 RepID=A0A0F9KPH3_9ZZZZ